MKFIRKKIICGHEYYYFEYPFFREGKRYIFSKFLGTLLPDDLGVKIQKYFEELAEISEKNLPVLWKKYFAPKSILPIEQSKFLYQSLHHQVFEEDLLLFRSLFGILFLLNSNRSEGSKVTRKDIEKIIARKRKPKTLLDTEVINSLAAIRYAFSKKMKWNIAAIKKLHEILFTNFIPHIAGKFKQTNNFINSELTTDWRFVRKEMKTLMAWFLKNKKNGYPPQIALEFHYRFEKIHPFEDGNGRIGRLLFNAYLLQQGYMPVIFFSENHNAYCTALSQARVGRNRKLAHYFIGQVMKTKKAVLQYKKEGIIHGGSAQIGRWEIEHGKIRKY